MKTIPVILAVVFPLFLGARAPAADSGATETGNSPAATQDENPVAANPVVADAGTNGLMLNFRGAPLNLVLDYLSDAAGFIINKEGEVRGTVDVWSKQPVGKEEAVELLNSVLKSKGYGVSRNGRILSIIPQDSLKTADLPIVSGSNPEDTERSDEVVTQIIPVAHASASQLLNNLQVLLPTSATLTVNESANSLILVATKTDVRRMLKIIKALDTSIASVASIKVFTLKFADAKQLVSVVQQLFPQQNTMQAGGQGGRGQMFNFFRGGAFGGGGPGGGAPGGQGGGAPGSGANAAGSRVVAAADDYSNSLIVSAAPDLMQTISDMIEQVDQPVSDVTELRVFHLLNADPQELADQFATLFPDESRSSNQGGGNFRFRFFGGGMNQGNRSGSSDRTLKKSRVIAVADPRTSSLIVTAAAEMMPQIAEVVAQLDSSSAKKERVAVFDLQNADPSDVNQVLQDLFNRNNTMRSSQNNRNSMLGQNNPLNQRITQQQNQNRNTATSRFNSGGTGVAGF
jgi:general secretion pathway protein D